MPTFRPGTDQGACASYVPGMGIWGPCPVPGRRGEHVHRGAGPRRSICLGRSEGGACPLGGTREARCPWAGGAPAPRHDTHDPDPPHPPALDSSFAVGKHGTKGARIAKLSGSRLNSDYSLIPEGALFGHQIHHQEPGGSLGRRHERLDGGQPAGRAGPPAQGTDGPARGRRRRTAARRRRGPGRRQRPGEHRRSRRCRRRSGSSVAAGPAVAAPRCRPSRPRRSEAERLGDTFVSTEHLLLGLAAGSDEVGRLHARRRRLP